MSDYEVLKLTTGQYIRDIARLENTILELRSELTATWTRHEAERVRLESERDQWKERAATEARRHLEHAAAWYRVLDTARTMLWEFAANTNLGQDKLHNDKRYKRICRWLSGQAEVKANE